MRLSALLIAATASAALVTAASAQTAGAAPSAAAGQTNTTTTSTTTTQAAPAGQAVNPPAASMGTPPVQAPGAPMGNTTPTPSGMAMSPAGGGAFRPITPAPGADIVAVLQASGQFTTLLKIADATNLTSILKSTPNLTLLAPTDSAFAALPPSALDLKDPANLQKLQALLTYHLINAKVPPLKGHSATAVQTAAPGKKVTLDGSGETVKINDATALQAQVAASNGVIYPIDKVLSPDYVPPPAASAPATADDAAPAATTTKKSTKKKR